MTVHRFRRFRPLIAPFDAALDGSDGDLYELPEFYEMADLDQLENMLNRFRHLNASILQHMIDAISSVTIDLRSPPSGHFALTCKM